MDLMLNHSLGCDMALRIGIKTAAAIIPPDVYDHLGVGAVVQQSLYDSLVTFCELRYVRPLPGLAPTLFNPSPIPVVVPVSQQVYIIIPLSAPAATFQRPTTIQHTTQEGVHHIKTDRPHYRPQSCLRNSSKFSLSRRYCLPPRP
jgi:hypothetical protein